jgi:cytidylate kinase
LGFHYLESGALYRLVALASLEAGVLPGEEGRLVSIAANLPAEFPRRTYLACGKDVTDAIRAEAVGIRASEIAPVAAVRMALLARQRAFRQPPGWSPRAGTWGAWCFPTLS